MRSRIFIIAAVILAALFFAVVASSSVGAIYWTTDKTEHVVYDSSWADRHNLVVVNCDGIGRPHVDSTGESYFKQFSCQGDYDAAFYGDGFTCTLTFSVRPVTDTRFALVGGDNPYCLPDQGYVPGN